MSIAALRLCGYYGKILGMNLDFVNLVYEIMSFSATRVF